MKRRCVPVLAIAAAAVPLSLAGCGGTAGAAVHDQASFGLAGPRLVVDIDASDLQLVPGTGHGVSVQRWRTGSAAQPGRASWTMAGGTLALSADCAGAASQCGARFRVAVPPGTAVVVNSGDGDDTVTGLAGPVDIRGGNGSVRIDGTTGPLQVSTSSGSVTGSAVRSADVQVTAGDGSVSVTFAAAPRLVDLRAGAGDATALVPAGGHRYHVVVSSTDGTTRSRVPDSPAGAGTIRVTSADGSASVLPAGA